MIVTLLIFFALIVLHYYVTYFEKKERLLNRLPGPRRLPYLGNALDLCRLTPDGIWTYLRTVCNQYYPILRIKIFSIDITSIRHPDDIETILSSTKHIAKDPIYNFFHPWLNTGLLTSEGAKWQKRRKILTPTFHFNILKQFIEILIEESSRMAKSLKDKEEIVIMDLMSFISHHTLNAICETAMGTSLEHTGALQEKYRQAIYDMGEMIIYRVSRPWFHNNTLFSLCPMSNKQAKCLKILHGFTEKIIAERKNYHERTNGQYLKNFETDTIETDEKTMGIRKKRLAMLDLLIAASYNNELSDMDIREEVDTFMFEGHDTTAMGISFALLLIAEHKEIQDYIRDEITAVMKENGGQFTITALQNMPYLERCLKESLRLYPSVPFITRSCAEDVKLHSYVIPSGTSVHLNIYDLHRDPNFWPNPDVFDPDRFLPEKIKNRHPYSYIPFSAGPRNCIGQRFAMLELKAMVASLVHDYYLEPIDYLKDIRFISDIVLRAAHPIRIKFIPIKSTY